MINELQYGWNLNIPLIGSLSSPTGQMNDLYRYNESTGNWYIYSGTSPVNWGTSGDIPLIGNFAHGGMRDEVIFRPSIQHWYVLNGTNDTEIGSFQWGIPGDVPLIGAWTDGQTMQDTAIFRPTNGDWFIRFQDQSTTNVAFVGTNGDIPLVGNFAGNGMVDLVTFTPLTGTWTVWDYVNNQVLTNFQWGTVGDIPVIGAWTDGQTMQDTAFFRPSTGDWWIRYHDGSTTNFHYGTAGDVPLVSDFYGNGMIDEAMYRASDNTWYIRNGVTGASAHITFGN